MVNLFIEENDVIKIKLFVGSDGKDSIFCDLEENGVIELAEGNEDIDISECNFVFKKPSFGDIIEVSNKFSNENQAEKNDLLTRLNILYWLLKDWDLVDAENKKIEMTKENVKKLHPLIITALTFRIDSIIGVSLVNIIY